MQNVSGSALPCPEGRYTKLPDALLSELSPREHQLVHLLLSYRWTDDALIYPRIGTLAERLRCSERTIQRTLRSLEAGGWLVTVARYRDDTGQTSNEYRPGPLLAPLLSAGGGAGVTRQSPPWHHPVTRQTGERYPGKRDTRTRGPERDYYQTREGRLPLRT